MTTEMMTIEGLARVIRRGAQEEARAALDGFQETDENRTELTFLRGYLQEMSFDAYGAFATYEKVLEQDPEHCEAAFRAALLADQAGDDESAIALYEQCVAERPTHINALINLAVLYEERGDLPRAESRLTDVLETYPNHHRARQFLKSVKSSYTMVYDELTQREQEKRNAILDMPVSDFELSVRSRNCLRQMNIRTLSDLLRTTETELLAYKNFGETSLNEIKAMLAQKSLTLGQGPEEPEEPVLEAAGAVIDTGEAPISKSVAELELSVRSRKALQRLGIVTISDLTAKTEAELMGVKNFGQTSLSEIKQQLACFGLSLRQTPV